MNPAEADSVSRLGLRVSDADREETVRQLSAAYEEGRLDLRELEQRTAAALAARTRTDLSPLVADLPHPTASTRVAVRRTGLATALQVVAQLLCCHPVATPRSRQ